LLSTRWNVLFFATPEFALPSLKVLFDHPLVNLSHIVSMPDRPVGRGQQVKSPPVIEFAKSHHVPFTQTENINNEKEFLDSLQNKVDLIIVLAFAQFLKEPWLKLPRLGCFNIHTSLLPRYRGAAPIQYALLNNDCETGVCIQKMVQKMDAGDVALERKIKINEFENAGTLTQRLQLEAALALSDFLTNLKEDKLVYKKQNELEVSFAPEIRKEAGHLDFSLLSRQEVLNRLRAYSPWPGLFIFLNNKRLKILNLDNPQPSTLYQALPGEIKSINQCLIIGCHDGPLRLSSVQPEGKSATSDENFLRGWRESLVITKGPK